MPLLLSRGSTVSLPLLGKDLVPAESVKDLGVIFDPNLNFNKHIVTTVLLLCRSLLQINRTDPSLSRDLLETTITTFVFASSFTVLQFGRTRNICKLQGVQSFAARIVPATRKFYHITSVLKALRCLPVKTQLYYRDVILSFKCITGRVLDYLTV